LVSSWASGPRALHSFPTRRSSDLTRGGAAVRVVCGRDQVFGEGGGRAELLLGVAAAVGEVGAQVVHGGDDALGRHPRLAQPYGQLIEVQLIEVGAAHRDRPLVSTARTDSSKASQRAPSSSSVRRPSAVSR